MKGIEFGEKLKEIRKKEGVSSKVLSKKVDKAVTYVSQLERGLIKKPDYSTCKKILLELGFSIKDANNLLYSFNILSPEQRKIEEQLILHSIEEEEEKIKSGYYEKIVEENLETIKTISTLFNKILNDNEAILDSGLLEDLKTIFTVAIEKGEQTSILENITTNFSDYLVEDFTTDTLDRKEHD